MSLKKPVTLQMKQDFLVQALADNRFHRRGKVTVESKNANDEIKSRRVTLSAFDSAVLCCIVFHCHPQRGYSFIGGRKIAELMSHTSDDDIKGGWKTSPSGVAKSIEKLKALNIITEIEGAKRNRAQRLAPNWDAYLDFTVHSLNENNGVHTHDDDEAAHSHEGAPSSTPIEGDEKERKRTSKEAKGTGRASLASAPSPDRVGGYRSARPKNRVISPGANVEAIIENRRLRKKGVGTK